MNPFSTTPVFHESAEGLPESILLHQISTPPRFAQSRLHVRKEEDGYTVQVRWAVRTEGANFQTWDGFSHQFAFITKDGIAAITPTDFSDIPNTLEMERIPDFEIRFTAADIE